MPFEITPEPYVPPGTPVEPQNTSSFGITPEPYVPPGTPVEPPNTTAFDIAPAPSPPVPEIDSFIQWQSGGFDLGDAKVLVVNFRLPLLATRGVGEHENVITVRRVVPAPPPPPPPPPPAVYYTSILYPLIFEDEMAVTVPTPERSALITVDLDATSVDVPSLESGTLEVTISFITYDNSLLYPDEAQVFVPSLESGTLVVTISYVTYDPRAIPGGPDPMQVPVPALESGTLVVVISYITYDNSLLYPDPMQVPVPTLQSGTLV